MPSTRVSEDIAGLSDKELENKSKDWKNEKLLTACLLEDLAAVKRLVAANADVNYTDRNGTTPLYGAILERHLPIVQYLISQDAKIEEEHFNTAVQYSANEIVQTLINAGAEVADTHLELAIEENDPDMVQTLMNAGAKVSDTHLELAIEENYPDMVQTLMNAGAKVSDTHLELAIKKNYPDMVQTLINAGAKVSDAHLEIAVEYSRPEAVKILINAGAKVSDDIISLNEQEITKIITGDRKFYNHKRIADTYKVHEILTRKTTREIVQRMKHDNAGISITKQKLRAKFKDAIKFYEKQMQHQIAGVTLTEAEQKQLNDIFATGSEKDYFVRINFVGFTGAGKTSIMLQMFLQKFQPSKITSTDGIDICLGYCIIDLATGEWRKYDKKENDERLERLKAITMTEEMFDESNSQHTDVYREPNSGPQSSVSATKQSRSEKEKVRDSGATGEIFEESENQQHAGTKEDKEPKCENQNILLGTTQLNSEQERTRILGVTGEPFEGNDRQHSGTNVDREPKPESQRKIFRTTPSNYKQENVKEWGETGEMFDESCQQQAEDLTGVETIYERTSSRQTEMHHGLVDTHLAVRIQQASKTSVRNTETAFVNGFDYAGQATYYALHQLFFSKRGINLIVLDASRNFDDPIDDEDARHIGGHLTGNSKDFFRYWSKLLRYFLPRSQSTKIITVFTHKDLVQDQGQLQNKMFDIQEIIEEMKMNEMFYKDIFCVNANDPSDKDLHQLRHVILGISKTGDDWGQRMPSTWLLLEDKLMTKKSEGIRVMTLNEVEELNEKSSLRLKSREELFLFLKVHHDIGTLIHFLDEGLQNVVILDAQWLVDSFKTIISAKQFKDHIHRKEWNRLHKKGIVDEKFILRIWKNHERERFYEFQKELILLMNTMDLISKPRMYNTAGKHIQSTYYVVPCMLQQAPDDFLSKYQEKATYSNNALSFEFEYSFLPTATVYRLLATCIMQYGDSEKSKTSVYCNAAVFRIYEHHFLTLKITSSSIIANILVIGKRCVDVGVSQGAKEFLENTIKCIIDAQKTATKYDISVACGNSGTDGASWLKWKDLMEKSSTVCDWHENDPPHNVDSDEIIKQWLVTKITRTELQTTRQKIHDKSKFDEKPTHILLGRISRRIPKKDIHLLFTALGLEVEDKISDDQNRTNTLLLLFDWLGNPNATLQTLISALKEQQDYILDIEEVKSISSDWRADFPTDILDQKLSDATDVDKDNAILMTGARYLQLGLELGFIKEEIDIFEKDYRLCQKITKQIITSWAEKQNNLATWKVLGDALYEIRANPEFIKDICNTTRVSKKSCAVA